MAVERVGRGVEAPVGMGSRRRLGPLEEMPEEVDAVRDVQLARVVRVRGVEAWRLRTALDEVLEDEDRVLANTPSQL